jgi:prepilin-type processing-associated H-X9-DG protein
MTIRAIVAAALLLPACSFAQTLADKVPADAVVYLGWKGSDSPGSEYEKSHLKAVLDATDWSVLGSDTFARGLARATARANRQFAQVVPSLLSTGKELLRYPSAIYVVPSSRAFSVVWIADVGQQAQTLEAELQAGPLGKAPILISSRDSLVTLRISPSPTPESEITSPLASSPAFKAAMREVEPTGVVVSYVNVEGLLNLTKQLAPPQPEEQAKVLSALGLDGVKSFACSGSFLGSDFATSTYLAAPAPRRGLLKFIDGAALSPETLKVVPQSATFVSAGTFDLAGLLDEARQVAQALDPAAAMRFDSSLNLLKTLTTVDVRQQLAASLGREWVMYGDPTIAGNSAMGWVIANRLKDPATAQASLGKLETALAAMARKAGQQSGMSLPVYKREVNGQELHCFALPLISPTWTIREGVLYIGFYPQSVIAATDFAASGKPSFASHPQVAAMEGKLPAGITFYDLPRTAPGSYGFVLALSRYPGFADLFGIPTPIVAVPPLPTLMQHLAPSMTTSYADAGGWHMRSVSPFPGAELLAGNVEANAASFQAPLAMSILLPSLAKARETANRAKCSNNLRQIALAEMMYANDNRGRFAPDLDALITTQTLSANVFTCPSASGDTGHRAGGMPCSYIYVGQRMTTNARPEAVIAYEPLENHGGQGSNFAFADGHVEWLAAPQAAQMIEQLAAGQNPPTR